MELRWRERSCKTLLLGACQTIGHKALGSHTGKTIGVSVYEP